MNTLVLADVIYEKVSMGKALTKPIPLLHENLPSVKYKSLMDIPCFGPP